MTNQIIISDISIHKDGQGRYSLNDLHTASGKEDKHQPAFFMRRHETIEMINEISNSAKSQSWKPTISKSGRYGGTYVCKELVYAYAMWISAAFALKVIRAYDALVSGNVEAKPKVRQCTATQLTPLRQTAERLITTGLGKIYPDIWKLVHQRFDVEHIHQLQPEQVGEAIEYLNVLEGEFLGKQELLPAPEPRQFTDEELCTMANLWRSAAVMYEACREVYPLLLAADHRLVPRFCSIGANFKRGISKACVILRRETDHIKEHPFGDSNWKNTLTYDMKDF